MEEIIKKVTDAYLNPDDSKKKNATLAEIAKKTNLTQATVRKMLITAGVYKSKKADQVAELTAQGMDAHAIAEHLGLSHGAVMSYMPYTKTVYNLENPSAVAAYNRELRREHKALRSKDVDGGVPNYDLPFILSDAQEVALEKIERAIESNCILMIYGACGTGKTALLKFANRMLYADMEKLNKATYQSGNKVLHYFSDLPYTNTSDLLYLIGRTFGLKEKKECIIEELKVRKAEGIKDILIINDFEFREQNSLMKLSVLSELNCEVGIPIILGTQPYTYMELMKERRGSKKKNPEAAAKQQKLFKDIDRIRNNMMFHELHGMTEKEVYRYLQQVEEDLKLQITWSAQCELVDLATDEENGALVSLVMILHHLLGLLFVPKDTPMNTEGWYRRYEELKEKANITEIEGKTLVTRKLIYFTICDFKGGMSVSEL